MRLEWVWLFTHWYAEIVNQSARRDDTQRHAPLRYVRPASYCEPGFRSAVADNIRRRILGVMFPPSIFEDRWSMCRLSKIDVSPFEDRCVALRRSMSRCVDLRRSMCRPSEIDVLTFEDRWSMCRPSKIGDWCVDLRRSIVDVSSFEHRWSMWN